MELDYKAIRKRIKIARIKAGLTQERLAEMDEISPTHMSNIKTGTTRVSLTAIVSLANALSVTVKTRQIISNQDKQHQRFWI